jgi:predicted flap endonuclease-1-like 5' DNA nuclease
MARQCKHRGQAARSDVRSETLIAGNIVVDLPGGVSSFSLDVDVSQLAANAAQPPTPSNPWVITASDAAGNDESDPVIVPLTTQAGFSIDPASLRATISGSQVTITGTVKEPNSTPAILRVWMGSSSGQKLLTPPSFVEALLGGTSVSLVNGSASFSITIDQDSLAEGASPQSTETPWIITACDQSGGYETAPIIVPQATAGSAAVAPTPSAPSEDGGSLAEVEGIGPERAAVLRKAGVRSAADLLKQGATVAGRRKLAKDTAFSSSLILTWVNNVDLFRVIGVGGEYAELLELAGVDSVPELARRNPKELQAKLAEVNSEQNVVRRVPPLATVSKWIAGAKGLPRAVQH